MRNKSAVLVAIVVSVLFINVLLSKFTNLSEFVHSNEFTIFASSFLSIIIILYFIYSNSLLRRRSVFITFNMLLFASTMAVFVFMPTSDTLPMVVALAALAGAGAALLAVAERVRAQRSARGRAAAIPVVRCVLYAASIVAFSAGLALALTFVPPLVFLVVAIGGAVGMGIAHHAIEKRLDGVA